MQLFYNKQIIRKNGIFFCGCKYNIYKIDNGCILIFFCYLLEVCGLRFTIHG